MNAEDFKTAQIATEVARAQIKAQKKVNLPYDRVVGQVRFGSKLFERTVKAEITQASKLGFSSIQKPWELDDDYLTEIIEAGFNVQRGTKNLIEISWRKENEHI